MQKFLTAAGCAVRISDSSTDPANDLRPVLFLLHGYLENLDVWDTITPYLSEKLRVIAMDLPGHGISESKGPAHTMEFLAGVACGVIDSLGIEKCFLCGHSMGGYVSLEFLNHFPERLSGLILFHSTPNPDTEEKKANRLREIEIVREGRKDLLLTTVENGFASDNLKKFAPEIADLKEMAEMNDADGIIAILEGMMQRADHNKLLAETDVPVLLIFGRKDKHISVETASEIIAANPKAKVVWLEDSGHIGLIEQPAEAAEAILSFVSEH